MKSKVVAETVLRSLPGPFLKTGRVADTATPVR
jgi:hypothetical protein